MLRTLVLLLLLGLTASAQDLELRQGKKTLKHLSLAQLKKLAPASTLRLDGGTHNYWVLPIRPLLDKLYGPKSYSEDTTFVFVCQDGYRSPVKSEDLKKYPAYLAFATSDGKPFQVENKPAGPYYLVWDTVKVPERKTGGNWPFQVTAIERTSFSQDYAATLPPPKSSSRVQHGFALFRKHCLSCHQLNGQGGNMGVDLNRPYSVTEYIKKPYLHKLISNPQSLRARATMPGLDQSLKNRERAIQDIIAYLEAKAAQRRKLKAAKPHK